MKNELKALRTAQFLFQVWGSRKHAVLSDFSALFKVSLSVLRALIWPPLVSVRLYFAFKTRGRWKYEVLSDFSELKF